MYNVHICVYEARSTILHIENILFLLLTLSFTSEFSEANTKKEDIFGEIDKNQEFSKGDEEWRTE